MSAANKPIVLCTYPSPITEAASFANVKLSCDNCGCEITISESAKTQVPDADYLCPGCFLKDPRTEGEVHGRVLEGTEEDLAIDLGPEDAKRLVRAGRALDMRTIAAIVEAQHRAEKKGLWS